jgi:DNA-binding CsgD family transcriptional regulator
MASGDLSPAREPAQDILAGRAPSISDGALAGALVTIAGLAWVDGRIADAIGLFRAAVDRVERRSADARRLHPRQSLATALCAIGNFDAAQTLLDEDGDDIASTGDTVWKAASAIRQARLDLSAGRLDVAHARAHEGVTLAEELGTPMFVPLGRITMASVALMRGDAAAAGEQLKRCRASGLAAGFLATLLQWTEGRLIDAVDGPTRAAEQIGDLYRDATAQKRLIIEEPSSAAWLVRAAVSAGLTDRAELVAEAAVRCATNNPGYPSVAATAAHARGVLTGDPEDLQTASSTHVHPYPRASALEDLGVALDERSARTGRAMLELARDAYGEIGAEGDARRVTGRLDLSRARRRQGTAGVRAAGWASLTESERRIAELVAEGLTNRQAALRVQVSPYTVDFHLRQIFRKLGIGSRVELARLVFKRRGRQA